VSGQTRQREAHCPRPRLSDPTCLSCLPPFPYRSSLPSRDLAQLGVGRAALLSAQEAGLLEIEQREEVVVAVRLQEGRSQLLEARWFQADRLDGGGQNSGKQQRPNSFTLQQLCPFACCVRSPQSGERKRGRKAVRGEEKACTPTVFLSRR